MEQSIYKIEISRSALEHNISLLTKNLKNFFPVVKFNAYGHGLVEVSKLCLTFESAKKLAGFAVGTISEGVALRKNGISQPIVVLLGVMPNAEIYTIKTAKEYGLTIIVHDRKTLCDAVENGVSFAIKWNTGMNRLGFEEKDIPFILEYLEGKNPRLDLTISHLAMADILSDEGKNCTQSQINLFNAFTQRVKEKFPSLKTSLGQSACILTSDAPVSDIGRLGISMYGANPFFDTPWEDYGKNFRQVMHVSAPILSIREIQDGDGVGYGLETKMKGTRQVAAVGIGYSDGYRRSRVSEQGLEIPVQALYKGKRVPRLSNVCMQVSFFDVTGYDAKAGDDIYLLGGEGDNIIRPEELAKWWDTIAYETLCLLGRTTNRKIIN